MVVCSSDVVMMFLRRLKKKKTEEKYSIFQPGPVARHVAFGMQWDLLALHSFPEI